MAEPLYTLQLARAAYPTPMSKKQLGELLNHVAWQHRGEGWGLLLKPAGNNVPQPGTGIRIASDILFNRQSGIVYDVLMDAEGLARPVWNELGPDALDRWVAPILPGTPGPEPPTPEPPAPPPEPPPPDRLAQVEAAVAALSDRLVLLEARTSALFAAFESLVGRVKIVEAKPGPEDYRYEAGTSRSVWHAHSVAITPVRR